VVGWTLTKTPRSRRDIKILPNVVEVLRRVKPIHAGPETPVFTWEKTGLPIKTEEWSKDYSHFNRALRALNIRPRKFYATRHTFLSRMRNSNVDPSYLAQYSGTSPAMIERHYGRWMADGEAVQFASMKSEAERAKPENPRRGSQVRAEKPLQNKASPTGFEPVSPA
jgi:integrase